MVNAGEATLESVLAILEIEDCIEVAGDVIKDGHLVGVPSRPIDHAGGVSSPW